MKLDRRGFIKFAVGGAVGTALTPLPWKLMDDSAIWTQNWPWVPKLTRYADLSYAPTVCNLCPGGCGIEVRLVNQKKSIKIEGSRPAPVNQGKVCPMGAAGPQYQYSLARFQSPLKRVGARGSGTFAQVTWAAALEEVGAKLAGLRRKGLAHTVVMVSGRRNDLARALAERFMQAYGSPNLVYMPSLAAASDFAETAQFGRGDAVGYDLERSRFVLSFGCGIIEGWGSPVRSIQAYSRWRESKKAKLVQIDTRASLTASKADDWVAVAPGTEAALALGLAHVMIKNGLYDRSFVEKHTFGFEEFKALVLDEYDPGRVAALTGVPAWRIIQLAKRFARARRSVALAGKGRGDMPTPVYELMAVMSLNALKGNINRPGGVIVRKDLPLAPWPKLETDPDAEKCLSAPRLDLAGSDKYPITESIMSNLVESVISGRPYPVNLLIIDQANPAYLGGDPGAFRRALAEVPFVVTLSGLADDTSIQADLVLPQTSNFDGPADVINPPTLPYPLFGTAGPAISEPKFDSRPSGDIYIALAGAVGGSVKEAMPFSSHREMVEKSAAGLFASGRGRIARPEGPPPGAVFGRGRAQSFKDEKAFFKALAKGRFWYDPEFSFGDYAKAFKTPSGRFEFVSRTLEAALARFIEDKGREAAPAELGLTKNLDQLFIPHFEPSVPTEDSNHYPLLLAPVEQFKLVNNHLGNAPYLTKLLEDTTLKGNDLVIEIHPDTAKSLHLKEGDKAWLKTRKGRLAVMVHLFEGARPEVVYAPIGLGHTGFGHYLRGKGANPMDIMEPTTDPLSGQTLWWGTRASLTKV